MNYAENAKVNQNMNPFMHVVEDEDEECSNFVGFDNADVRVCSKCGQRVAVFHDDAVCPICNGELIKEEAEVVEMHS